MITPNTIYLRHARRVIMPIEHDAVSTPLLATLLSNMQGLGFTCSVELLNALRTLSPATFATVATDLVAALRDMVGAHVRYAPMYPNFPAQVMDAPAAELYLNALIHYLTGLLPVYPAVARAPGAEAVPLTVLELGTEADVIAIGARLMRANTALSASDRDDVTWFIAYYADRIDALLPDTIPHKETLALVAACCVQHLDATVALQIIRRYVRTATDVLRLAVAFSSGDVSLATKTRFGGFSRPQRRLLLGLLDGCAAPVEDMLRHREVWVRLGERLHPGEYAHRFPTAAAGFMAIRTGAHAPTFNSRVAAALRDRAVPVATDLLGARPGELTRRLDHLLRLSRDPHAVLAVFDQVADQVATPVLLHALAHFTHRHDGHAVRTFFPKGNVAKVQAVPNTLPPISEDARIAVVARCRTALISRFRTLPSLGRVYIEPQLRTALVPFSQRSASKALHTMVRGSRVPLPAGNTVRFFLWWHEGPATGRVDIDLSAVLYDAAWNYREHISYTNLRGNGYRAAHSGDITSAPHGACEFIDLDINSIAAYGGRYVVASLLSFTDQPYCDLPECYAGWMMRQHPESGDVFDPRTVQQKMDIASNTRVCIPAIIDVVAREIIWTDVALRTNPMGYTNVEGNRRSMAVLGHALTMLVKPTLYDLFALHAEARGTLVDDAQHADTVFGYDGQVTPFDTAVIAAEYLGA